MTKKMLQEYRWLKHEISQLEEKLLELDARAKKITTTISSEPRCGSIIVDRMAETVALIVDTQSAINEKVLASIEKISAVERAITMLPARERLLMRKRYIDCLEWEQICVDMAYGWRQIHNIHSEALKAIS